MSGSRTSTSTSTQTGPLREAAQGEMFRSPRAGKEPGEVIDFGAFGAGASDPNNSIELRDMVSVATTYFDRGLIDDAEEMLQEALGAGYSRTDALELRQRIRAIRGPGSGRLLSPNQEDNSSPGAGIAIDEFTIPLPGAETQSVVVRRAIEDGEADLAAGRLLSAHDITLYAVAHAPAYLPIYVRMAELRIALGDQEGAQSYVTALQDALEAIGDDGNWLTLSMRVTLDPDNDEALLALARALLDQRGTIQLEPYVPEAIERSMSASPELARELATEYARLRPTAEQARRLHMRAIIAFGDEQEIGRVLRQDVRTDSSADLQFVRGALGYADGRDAWFQWLERAAARVIADSNEWNEIPRAIDAARRMLPAAQHALATAVMLVAHGDGTEALAALTPWSAPPGRDTSDAREMLVAACARAFALVQAAPVESIEALANAVGQAVVLDVRPFAESSKLFAHSISAESLMRLLVNVVRETGHHDLAIMHLQSLRDRLPEHLEIRTGLADLQVAAGKTAEGVRELRFIAERYEQAGNIDRMVDAMRHISAAVPNNTEMKAKLIEGYIQRGVPEEAMRELRLLGDLHLKRGRGSEAADAYRRGAEIASTTGSFRRALDLFDKAIAADPDNVGVRHAAVAYYIMTGAVDRATEQLREVVRIAIQEQDPDEAVAALHQIIGLAPADASAYHKLGEVLTALGEYAQAERVYRRLSAFTPDDPVLAAKQSALSALASGQ